MSAPQSQIGYSPQIDALRAVAVGGVLFTHFWMPDTQWGHLGVRLFFVLSGYLITAILLSTREAGSGLRQTWKAFYIRRAVRIFPAYYLLLVIGAVLSPEIRAVIPWHALYASNLLFASTDSWGYWPLSHLWSLSVEEQFYLVWPFVVLLVPHRALIPVLVSVIVSAVLFRFSMIDAAEGPAKYVLTPAAFDALGAGGLLAALEQRGQIGTWARRAAIVLAALAMGAIFWMQGPGYSAQTYYLWADTLLVVPMVAAVIACRMRTESLWGWIFGARPLRALGRISYGIYLFHFPILALIFRAYASLGVPLPQHGPTLFLLASSATVAVAAASWFCLERPALRLKSKFGYAGPEHPSAKTRPLADAAR